MRRSKLTKEQKQYLTAGVLVVAVVAILAAFGIKVSLSSISEARQELRQLTDKIESSEKSVAESQRRSPEFHSTISELKQFLANMPPDRNFYSWATEIIYNEARHVAFEVDAIDETVRVAPDDKAGVKNEVELESYALRIAAHGGYENVKQFLRRLAANHPLVRVTGVDISAGNQPEIHNVQLFIEWPFNLGYITESWKSAAPRPSPDGSSRAATLPHPPPPRTGGEQTNGNPSGESHE